MFETRKILKKLRKTPAFKEAQEIDYDKDGRAQIYVGLKEADDFFSPFAYKTYELLNPDVTDYINMCESNIPLSSELALEIYTEEKTSNDEKKRIRRGVKRHYAEQIVSQKLALRKKTWQGIIFSFLGLVILLAEALIYTAISNLYLDTIMAVIGWSFLGDGIGIFTWERNDIRREQIKCYRLINAKVHIRQYSKKIQREFGIGEFEEEDDDE